MRSRPPLGVLVAAVLILLGPVPAAGAARPVATALPTAGAPSAASGAPSAAAARPSGAAASTTGAAAFVARPSRPGSGEQATGTTDPPPVAGVTPDIIPKPNSGQRPDSPGDRGGAQQLILFVLICTAIVLVGVLAFLDGRRHKRRAGGRGGLAPRREGAGAEGSPAASPEGSPAGPPGGPVPGRLSGRP